MQVQTVNTTAIVRSLEITVKTRKLYVGGGAMLELWHRKSPVSVAGRVFFVLSFHCRPPSLLVIICFFRFSLSLLHPCCCRQWRRNYGDRGVHCTPPQVQDLYGPLYPPSQRYGLCQNFKQTTLTTRLYKFRTDLNPPPHLRKRSDAPGCRVLVSKLPAISHAPAFYRTSSSYDA